MQVRRACLAVLESALSVACLAETASVVRVIEAPFSANASRISD